MNIERVRKIDRWIGVPLCFLLTSIRYITKLIPIPGGKAHPPKKFLFIELSEMGSAILAYPAMNKIRKIYPGAEIFFVIFKKNRASVDILKIIPEENVLTIRDDSLFPFIMDTVNVVSKVRKEKIDVTFDLELFSRFTAILAYLSGARKRVGFYKYYMEGLYRGELLTHKVQYNFQQHIALSFLSFVQTIKTAKKEVPTMMEKVNRDDLVVPKIKSSEENMQEIWNKLKPINPEINQEKRLILINPNPGKALPIRAWPSKSFIKLAKELLKDETNFIIVIGTEEAETEAKVICDSLSNKRCINLANRTTFRELLDLYNISDILITNDSGVAHFASLTPIKAFVFFGPETPILYSPLGPNVHVIYSNFPCSPCLSAFNHRKTACQDNKCLQAIKVDEVYNLTKKKL